MEISFSHMKVNFSFHDFFMHETFLTVTTHWLEMRTPPQMWLHDERERYKVKIFKQKFHYLARKSFFHAWK